MIILDELIAGKSQPQVAVLDNSLATINWITFEKESGKALTMQMTWMGRLYQCGVEGKWYGTDEC